MDDRYRSLKATLKRYGQAHLLAFYHELAPEEQARLLGQLEALDWPRLAELIETHVLAKPEPADASGLKPAPYYPKRPSEELAAKYVKARRVGEALIRGGKVAAFTVAGGQGTRLGWDGPKGTFPATPVTKKSLFQVFAEYLLKVQEKYGVPVPWYLMTSPGNDAKTRTFFAEHAYFGLEPEQVVFFSQGTMPSVGYDGKLLLAARGELALSPDGTGGSLKALYQEGALDDMQRRGVELISYFQVDNPNVKCLDPLFLGLHALDEAEVSSKMVPKALPQEKVGVFARQGERMRIVEYSELPRALAEARSPDGTLAFAAGSVAIHVFSCDFVRRVNAQGFSLPYHRADKKVAHLDPASGARIEPDGPNAVKLEHFVFDALPLAQRTLVLETDRVEEFAPIKNASGVDSPESSKRLQSERAARWLAACGVEVPVDADGNPAVTLELSHLTAIEPDDLRGRALPRRLAPGEVLAL